MNLLPFPGQPIRNFIKYKAAKYIYNKMFSGPVMRSGSFYSKRFARRPTYRKRHRFGRRSSSNFIKQVIQSTAESKESLNYIAGNLTTAGGSSIITLVNGIAEGTDYNTRVGRSIKHKYVEVNLTLVNYDTTGAGAALGDCGFWALVLDRQPNGVAPSFADIFDTSNGNPPGTALRNTFTYQDRFKILATDEWSVGACTGTATANGDSNPPYRCKRYIDLSKLKGRDDKTMFSAAGGGIAQINEGAVYFVLADTYSSAASTTQYNNIVKYRFTDT